MSTRFLLKQPLGDFKYAKSWGLCGLLIGVSLACTPMDTNDADSITWQVSGVAADGFVLPNAPITVSNANGNTIHTGTTNAQGAFSLELDVDQVVLPLILTVDHATTPPLSTIVIADTTTPAVRLVNPLTNLISNRLLAEDTSDLTSRVSRQISATLMTITLADIQSEMTRMTTAMGADAKRFFSNADFQGRIAGDDSAGSIEDDLIETIKEQAIYAEMPMDTMLQNAMEGGTPLLSDRAIQCRLAANALGRISQTTADLTEDLANIVPASQTAVLESVNQQFNQITAVIEQMKTVAQSKSAFTSPLVRVALESLEEALMVEYWDNETALGLTDSASFIAMVTNTGNLLSDPILDAVEAGASNSILQSEDTLDLRALTTVVTNAARQAITIALAFNMAADLSPEVSSFLTTEMETTFSNTQTQLLEAIEAVGLANLTTALANVNDAIKNDTLTQLNAIPAKAQGAGLSAELNPNFSEIIIFDIQLEDPIDIMLQFEDKQEVLSEAWGRLNQSFISLDGN